MPDIPAELRSTTTKIFEFTEYFRKSRAKPGHVDQMAALEAISNGIYYEEQIIDKEIRHCVIGTSSKYPGKYIRIIIMKDFKTIHNAFFDRAARRKLK